MIATLSSPFFSLRFVRRARPTARTGDDTAARRDFVNEMICENPNAFASDLDVYEMMTHFPGKF